MNSPRPTNEKIRKRLIKEYKGIYAQLQEICTPEDIRHLKSWIKDAFEQGAYDEMRFEQHTLLHRLHTLHILLDDMGLKRSSVISLLILANIQHGSKTIEDAEQDFGSDVCTILNGLVKTQELYSKSPVIESENFRNLLLSFAEDMRVILILIADRVNLMRAIRYTGNEEMRKQIATEAAYLYAPLAHKLGLYKLKSELEDLSLKYMNREMFTFIKDKLQESKESRDIYIAEFIAPIEKKLKELGLNFSIKGRTKSIHSIWNKLMKQNTTIEKIYDLFAIRIVLDTPMDREKLECWQVYSVITDMYNPNPKRLKDWLSVPKSNGYESLHTTVMGPEGKWVEVQIRTQRMDEIAERGFAAHWRYKGVKSETGLDEWLTNMREALETQDVKDSREVMDQFKMELYEDEVFVFTPKGDLYQLPKGATVLDFAFRIHSRLGCQCTGAIVNNKHVQLKYELGSGDQVEILSSSTQTPKQDWLNFVTTSKARHKIRQSLKELQARYVAFGKEELERKFKNRKLVYEEKVMMRLIKKRGYKTVTEFMSLVGDGSIGINDVIDSYLALKQDMEEIDQTQRSAGNYTLEQAQKLDTEEAPVKEDVLVIDQNLKGVEFHLSKCCNPIYGDDVFGFVTINEGIKIHRTDCPNSTQMRERYGYRIVPARWAGKSLGKQYPITLRVVGQDDIGIVTNITSIITKEPGVALRNISIDSNDGLFNGTLTVMVSDQGKLNVLTKKLQGVKGVKNVMR